MTPRTSLVAILLISAGSGCASTSASTRPDQATFEARLDPLVPRLLARHHVPGAQIVVVRDGSVVWARAFGRAGTTAVASETRFEAGSLGKPVFAYEVMLLAHRGLIDLDRPLARILPPPTSDPRAAQITARMVLSHVTGFPNWARGKPFELAFAPGSRWQYSGEAYNYLQRVVEHLTGESIDASVRRDIFIPLGMTRSAHADPPAPEASWAMGHDRAGRPLEVDVHHVPSAASSLRTTALDYARFVAAMLAPRSDVVGEMLRPAVGVAPELGLSWGLGWALADQSFFHWGVNPGFKSFTIGEPARKLAIVLFTNGDDGLEMAEEIVRAIDGDAHAFFRFPMIHPND
jgi:CubicO group peptidase (beta-lactamase class C family)